MVIKIVLSKKAIYEKQEIVAQTMYDALFPRLLAIIKEFSLLAEFSIKDVENAEKEFLTDFNKLIKTESEDTFLITLNQLLQKVKEGKIDQDALEATDISLLEQEIQRRQLLTKEEKFAEYYKWIAYENREQAREMARRLIRALLYACTDFCKMGKLSITPIEAIDRVYIKKFCKGYITSEGCERVKDLLIELIPKLLKEECINTAEQVWYSMIYNPNTGKIEIQIKNQQDIVN